MPNQNRIKSSLTSRKKGIYIEYIEVMNGTYHSYLTFEDGEGNTRVIRGGPTNASLSNAIFGGDIEMQSDIPLSKSRDAYGIEDTPQTRHSTKLDLEGRSPEKVWKTMKETASLITKGKIDYDLHETLPKTGKMQNSNTVVSNVLRGAGLDPTKVKTPNPETYMAKVYGPTPGFNKNLMKESAYDGWDIITGSSNEAFQTKLYHLQNKSKNDIFNADQEMKAIDKRNSATKLEPKQQSGLDTEAQEKIKTAFTTADDELSETVLKKGSQLTSDEVKKLMTQRARLPDGPEKSRLEQTVQSHFGDVYGNDRVETSITGRMLEPEAKIAIPEKETPATTLGGTKIVDALAELGQKVAKTKGSQSGMAAVQALQSGLNLAMKNNNDKQGNKQTTEIKPGVPTAKKPLLFTPLKADGDAGPKTRQAARSVLANLPSGTAEEGMALGQFEKIASRAKTVKPEPEILKSETSNIFGSLFRTPEEATPQTTPEATHEGLGLQATINDIGTKSFGEETFKPIKEDGIVGPKTTDAFSDVMKASNPNDFVSSMSDNMGFFSFA